MRTLKNGFFSAQYKHNKKCSKNTNYKNTMNKKKYNTILVSEIGQASLLSDFSKSLLTL